MLDVGLLNLRTTGPVPPPSVHDFVQIVLARTRDLSFLFEGLKHILESLLTSKRTSCLIFDLEHALSFVVQSLPCIRDLSHSALVCNKHLL